MNWKNYEKEVHQYFSEMYPGAQITYDAKIVGRYSKRERQIDVLIEDDVAGFPIRVAIDAKYFSKNIDVKCVESFISMMEDVEANQGLLVTNVGYSKAAINRAYYGPKKLDLDVLNFDEILKNQEEAGMPYSRNNAISIAAPLGWIVDNSYSKKGPFLACLYQRGKSFEQAQKDNEWMYVNFFHKYENVSCIEDLVNKQNKEMKSRHSKLAFKTVRAPKRSDGLDTYIRSVIMDQTPYKEITGFIDFGEFIAMFVMFTPEQLENKNIRKLVHLLNYTFFLKIKFNYTKSIEELKDRCKSIIEPQEKADALRQIADLYSEMNYHEETMVYRRQSFDVFPENYENIRPLISGELKLSQWESAIKYSLTFFSIDPTNPSVMQDLITLYGESAYKETFDKIIAKLETLYANNSEVLANIQFHYGNYLLIMGNNKLATEYFRSAKNTFESFNKNHYAIAILDDALRKKTAAQLI